MSLSEEGQRAAFAAWAATEGVTEVGFNPVEAAGITVGRVYGVRDHHLVLLDREWAIWVASQRSRAAVEASPSAGEREAKIANERDRTVVARCLTAFDRAVAARGWLTQGRGPYEWDDDRFYAEFGHAVDEFRKSVEPLRRIAIDMTHVPKDDAGVADGRAAAASMMDGPVVPSVCPRCRGGGFIILADLPDEGLICGGRCPCGALRTPQDERERSLREAESRAAAALEKVARAYGYERAWVAPSGEPNIILERPHPSAKGMIEVTRLDLVVHIARAVADRMTPATESKPS